MTEPIPQTEAGRSMLADTGYAYVDARRLRDRILAIEAQARTEALDVDALRVGVHKWFCVGGEHGDRGRPVIGWACDRGAAVIAREYAAILAAKADR